MRATPEQIAQFINRHPSVAAIPRAQIAAHEGPYRQRPTADALATDFLASAEFEALQLGQFLDTPNGQLIRAGVVAASPAFAAADIDLIADALILAARAQRRGKFGVAAVLTGVAALVAVGLLSGPGGNFRQGS